MGPLGLRRLRAPLVIIAMLAFAASSGCASGTPDSADGQQIRALPTPTPTPTAPSTSPEPTSSEPGPAPSPTEPLAAYLAVADPATLPEDAQECEAVFDRWAPLVFGALESAAEGSSPELEQALAGQVGAFGAGLADCMAGRPVDRAALSAEQERLEEVAR